MSAGTDQIERAILGGILRHGLVALGGVEIYPADFAVPAHGAVFRWLSKHPTKWVPGDVGGNQTALADAGLAKELGEPNSAAFSLHATAEGICAEGLRHYALDVVAASIERAQKKAASSFAEDKTTAKEFQETLRQLDARAAKDGKAKAAVREIMLARLYDPKVPVPPAVPVLDLRGVTIATEGNIGALAAGKKAGKSSTITAAIASLANTGGGTFLGVTGHNKQGRPVLHLDTEQSKAHHDEKVKTIQKRLDVDELPANVMTWQLLGERLGIEFIRTAVEIAKERHGHPPVAIFLDGGVDFLADPNDGPESFEFVRALLEIAQTETCFILASIHYNEGNELKTRGHLGSELARKSEVNLSIKVDSENLHRTLYTPTARGAEVPQAQGVIFAFDARAGMFEVLGDKATGYTITNVLTILAREGSTDRKQLKKLLRENYGGDSRTWDSRIQDAHRERLVTTSGKPVKVCLTENGKCRLRTAQDREDDGHDGDPF